MLAPVREAAEPQRAPFPWFGGKREAAAEIWERLGDVANFVDPCMGPDGVAAVCDWPVSELDLSARHDLVFAALPGGGAGPPVRRGRLMAGKDWRDRPPKPKPAHRDKLVNQAGGVSALCFARPRSIDLRRATWTLEDVRVTCSRCLAALGAA